MLSEGEQHVGALCEQLEPEPARGQPPPGAAAARRDHRPSPPGQEQLLQPDRDGRAALPDRQEPDLLSRSCGVGNARFLLGFRRTNRPSPRPSPRGRGRNSDPLSPWERVRVRADLPRAPPSSTTSLSSNMLEPARYRRVGFGQQSEQSIRVDRLDQVMVEARLPGPAAGRTPGPSRSAPPGASPRTRAGAAAAWRPRSRPSPACRCRAGRPRAGTPRRRRAPRGRRGRPGPPGRRASSAAWPGSSPRPRCRPRPGCGGGASPGAGRVDASARYRLAGAASARGPAGGRRTRCPCPALRCAAATLPPCISTRRPDQAQADPQPPLGAVRAVADLDEHLEDPGQHLGLDPDPRVPDPDDDLARPRAGRRAGSARPARCT